MEIRIYVNLVKGEYIQSSTYVLQMFLLVLWKFLLVMWSSCHHEGFSAFLDMKRCKNWAHKIFSRKYLTIWRSVLPVFSEHRVPHFSSPPQSPFKRFWRSAVAVAHNLILIEVNSRCQFVGDTNSPSTHKKETSRKEIK